MTIKCNSSSLQQDCSLFLFRLVITVICLQKWLLDSYITGEYLEVKNIFVNMVLSSPKLSQGT